MIDHMFTSMFGTGMTKHDPGLSAKMKMLLRGVNTKRFHTVPTIGTETVGHHSALVAGIALVLWPTKHHLLAHAILHDLPEHVTGDTPSPGKRMFVDRDRLISAEEKLMGEAGFLNIPALEGLDIQRLKACDILAGLVTCMHELLMGNQNMQESLDNYWSYLKSLPDLHRLTDDGSPSVTDVANLILRR